MPPFGDASMAREPEDGRVSSRTSQKPARSLPQFCSRHSSFEAAARRWTVVVAPPDALVVVRQASAQQVVKRAQDTPDFVVIFGFSRSLDGICRSRVVAAPGRQLNARKSLNRGTLPLV
jgi:hypothetical protein